MQTKLIRIALVVAAVLALAACRKGATGDATPADTDALTGVVELAVGTLRLEDTDQALDATAASELLPLWKAYRALMTSDTTVTEELEGLESQIREAMPTAAVQAIDAMALTEADSVAVLQERGGFTDGAAGLDAEEREAMRAAAESSGFEGRGPGGGMPAGGAPPDGGGFGGGAMGAAAGMDPSAIETLRAEGGAGTTTQANRMMVPLIQAVITALESKL